MDYRRKKKKAKLNAFSQLPINAKNQQADPSQIQTYKSSNSDTYSLPYITKKSALSSSLFCRGSIPFFSHQCFS